MHSFREQESLEIHRRVARLMNHDAAPVLKKAKENIQRWLVGREENALGAVYREWENLLQAMTPAEISSLLVEQSERATRLRQSSPFAGVLSAREIWEIKREKRNAAA